MKTVFVILATLFTIQSTHASYVRAVKGKIETNDPDFDLSQVTVQQTLYCKKGLFGHTSCGEKTTSAQVNSKGEYQLDGIRPLSHNWFKADYVISYKGKSLFYNAFRTDKNPEAIRKFLSHFTIFIIKPFNINLTTDTGIDFNEWMITDNRDVASELNISLDVPEDLIPRQYFDVELKRNPTLASVEPLIFPGGLKTDRVLNYQIRSRKYYDQSFSVIIADKKIPFNDELFMEKLSNTTLNTKLINYSVDGLWELKFYWEFNDDGFKLRDPNFYLTGKCENGVYNGSMLLKYSKFPKNNHTQIVQGSCSKGNAEFDLSSLLIFNSADPNDSRSYNLRFNISQVAGKGGILKVSDAITQKVYADKAEIDLCKRFQQGRYGLECVN